MALRILQYMHIMMYAAYASDPIHTFTVMRGVYLHSVAQVCNLHSSSTQVMIVYSDAQGLPQQHIICRGLCNLCCQVRLDSVVAMVDSSLVLDQIAAGDTVDLTLHRQAHCELNSSG